MNKTLYQWFADTADRLPHEPALEVRGAAVTYQELRDLAEALAERIVREHGEVPGRVALQASRSLVAFVGYLAVQRLGAAVVPLNPSHPTERNQTVFRMTSPDVLLADTARLRLQVESTVISVSDEDLASKPVGDLPPYRPVVEDLAYILFTSGSTGVPKGVPIRHFQVSPYLARHIERYQVGSGCRMSHTFDLTFDPSLWDLFVTWGGGGTLVVPQKVDLLSPVDYIVNEQITHWYSVPSVLSISRTLGNNVPEGAVTSLRYSIFVGEPLTYRHCAAWRKLAPGTVIENVYGPTEVSVTCTAYALPADPAQWPETSNDTMPIGAVDESLDYLLTDDGELCLRGQQRFDGYVDPAENIGRFLTVDDTGVQIYDGTGELTDKHYYRTGDRISIENGHWVHRGRLDNQVKVRGHRVELGEVEAVMLRHDGVREAIVVAVRESDELELVAVHTGQPLDAAEFMLWLRKRIPLHMVPRRFLRLEALPLNANGKADRRAIAELVTR
ncbi:AMP-binding protein [Kibdelosporangium aridum]|uniref:AMP-binding protein n=1 Tax=Kibdelosporangium aridum TaxID=2030 RepID=UPI0005266AB1